MVPRETALRVVQDELHAYQRTLEGVYGEEARQRAESLGLSGIVEEREIHAHHYIANDCMTGERRDSRPAKASKQPERSTPTELEVAHIGVILQALKVRAAQHEGVLKNRADALAFLRDPAQWHPSTRTGGKRQEVEIQKEIDDREYKLRLLREAIAYFER